MKVILGRVTNSINALKALTEVKVDALVSKKLIKLLKKVDEEMLELDQVRDKVIVKYSTDGTKVDDDKLSEFMDEIGKVLNSEIDLPDTKLTESDFPTKEFSTAERLQLEWVMPLEEEAKEEEAKEMVGELVA